MVTVVPPPILFDGEHATFCDNLRVIIRAGIDAIAHRAARFLAQFEPILCPNLFAGLAHPQVR